MYLKCEEGYILCKTHDSQTKWVFPFPFNRWENKGSKNVWNLSKVFSWNLVERNCKIQCFWLQILSSWPIYPPFLLTLWLLREDTTLSIWGSATKWLNWIVLKIEDNITCLKGVKIVSLPPGLVYTDRYSVFSSPRLFLYVLGTVPAWETVSREVFSRILRHSKWKRWH